MEIMEAEPVSSDVSSAEAHASSAWDAIVSAPEAVVVPAETPAEPATNADPAPEAKVEPAPTAVEGSTPEKVAAEPTAYDKWVAKYGDPNKAAEAAWETNNRASEQARLLAEKDAKLAELEAKLQTGAANAPAPVAAEIPPVVEAAPEQVDQWVSQYVAQDPACVQMDQAYRANRERLNVLTDAKSPDSIAAAAREVQKLEAWLQFPEVAADEFQRTGYSNQLALAQTRHERLLIEAQRLGFENESLKSKFDGRANQYRSQIASHYENQKREAQAQQEYQSTITRHAQDLEKAWPVALDRTIKENQIPEPLVAKFTKSLRTAAMAHLESGLAVDQIDTFMANEAKEFMSNLDAFHRLKSGEYARQATQRAANPAPVPNAVPQVQPSTGDPIKDAYAHEAQMWAQLGIGR